MFFFFRHSNPSFAWKKGLFVFRKLFFCCPLNPFPQHEHLYLCFLRSNCSVDFGILKLIVESMIFGEFIDSRIVSFLISSPFWVKCSPSFVNCCIIKDSHENDCQKKLNNLISVISLNIDFFGVKYYYVHIDCV